MSQRALRCALLACAVASLTCAGQVAAAEAAEPLEPLVLWHAYGDGEAEALRQVLAAFEAAHPGERVHAVRLPFGVLASRLESAVPTGNGPDLFIDAHERLGRYIPRGIVQPLDPSADPDWDATVAQLEPQHVEALRRDGRLYGLPLSAKAVALFINRALVPEGGAPPAGLEAMLRRPLPQGVWPLAIEGEDTYFVAPIFHAFGAKLFEDGRYGLARDGEADPRAVQALERLAGFFRDGLIPPEPSGELVTRLFGGGQAAYAISGPWLAASLPADLDVRVIPLPGLEGAGPMRPFVTVEAIFRAGADAGAEASPAHDVRVAALAGFLAGEESAVLRATVARQVVSHRGAWERFTPDATMLAFRDAARGGVVMPGDARMSQVFEPTTRAIRAVVRGGVDPAVALAEAEARFDDAVRALPEAHDPSLALVLLGALLFIGAVVAVRRSLRAEVRRSLALSLPAWRYVAASFFAVLLLVITPLVVGAAMSLFATDGSEFRYVGLTHYVDILSARGGDLLGQGSFWRVLLVTVVWTALNLLLHVAIGVSLALLLHRPVLRLRAVYRVLLILPWAVPSYVTALSWKGMFHSQYGAVNALLAAVGVEPVHWFSRFGTAFAANITTNVWLGFPFMMVVALGALSAIPKELYEAARVDGASSWQQLRHITLPLLWPPLLPAVAMGAVWTFNMFNVVFLVSGGEPGGSTEILVSEAYRWAFTRGARYGYAAAYAVLIFGILWLGTRSRLVSRAMQ
ncbi:MAG: extracellular solute-binding protein [Deltaproteobacteria bacterium]|nr:extracellular solute-binding protein [Deltaproteobacteria bacterium]